MSKRPNLKDHDVDALRARFAAWGLEPWRGEQVAAWLHARGVDDPARMTDLPAALRERLAAEWETRALEVDRVSDAADGTRKAALRARDGAVVEAVLIPEERRTTLCLSTQVGCPLACAFCATGAMGFTRNLRPAEILDQVQRMRELVPAGRRITNVVFMGMGEPLLNLAPVATAYRVLTHPKAYALAPRRITVSTVGVVPKLEPLLALGPLNLAISLHGTTDEVRNRLVPLGLRYPLDALLGALRESPRVTKRRPVLFEYTLIDGVNDAPEDARRLRPLLADLPAKVNLIPMNAHPAAPHRPPPEARIERFLAEVARSGLTVTLRRSRGADIQAACGQLARREGSRAA